MWWFPITIKDVIDVVLLSIFLFGAYRALRSSGSRAIFTGIFSFIILWIVVSKIMDMHLLGAVLDQFANIGFVILVIIFQEEVKQLLIHIGSRQRWTRLKRLFLSRQEKEQEKRYIAPIVLACMNMARKKTGALIVIQGNVDLSPWLYAGERCNAEVNSRLIETIFFKNSPLHDGAMIISDGRIQAAGCILPVANTEDLNKDLGLRHRAALGISQRTDALVVIISEERGTMSVARKGAVETGISAEVLQEYISAL